MVKFANKKVYELFNVSNAKSSDAGKLTLLDQGKYEFVGRSITNNGIQGYLDQSLVFKPNPANTIAISQIGQQMASFHELPWYASQNMFVLESKGLRLNPLLGLFFTTIFNCQLKRYGSYTSYPTQEEIKNWNIQVPVTADGELDTEYMASYVRKIEASYVRKIEAYLAVLGYKSLEDCQLNEHDLDVLHNKPKKFVFFKLSSLFPHIKQGKRLRKQDQISGNIPFIMSGETNQGFVKFIKNNLNLIPKNSLTIDILGNVFYRNYEYSISDDVGAYWSDKYTTNQMLYLTTSIKLAMLGKFSYGKKFRSSRSNNINVALPVTTSGKPDYAFMEDYITAIEKLKVIKIKQYLDQKLLAYQELTK